MSASVKTLVGETAQEALEAEAVGAEAKQEQITEDYDDGYDKWINRADKDLPILRLSDIPSYESEYRPLRVTEPMILIWVGLRGAGKSMGVSYASSLVMINECPCWTNTPIAFRVKLPNGRIKAYRSEKLQMDKLYKLQGEYNGGTVSIYELQYYTDCRRSSSTKNLVLNYDLMQIRHLHLSLYGDVKNIAWVDNRTQYETDVIFGCQDVHYTDWGWDNNVGKGEIIHWDAVDVSGYWTGKGVEDPQYAMQLIRMHKAYGEPNPLIHEFTLPLARLIWPIYPTNFIVNIMEAMRPVSYNDKIVLNNADAEKKHKQHLMTLEAQVNQLRNQGVREMTVRQMREEFDCGRDQDEPVWKKIQQGLSELHVLKTKIDGIWYYVL